MQDLASTTNRFLGGRPPYGSQLTDAGPHRNPGRAATGQRAHHLEPDPIAAPVVREIFELFSQGQGLRTIAQGGWRANRADGSVGRVPYRCGLRSMRSIPPELSDHPKTLYVREDHILPPLVTWIAELTSPEGLESAQPVPRGATAHASLRIGEIDRKSMPC